MKKLVLATTCFVIAGASQSFAQPWIHSSPTDAPTTFYDIRRSFNRYWEGKDHKERGKGWKAFKRWEWFWQQRVYPMGQFPNPMQLFSEYAKSQGQRRRSTERFSGSWAEIGPIQSAGGSGGLGRINCVRVDPINQNVIWAGTPSGGLWRSTDSGQTWLPKTDELPSIGVTDIIIDPADTDIMYMATGDGDATATYSIGVLKSTDGGSTWDTTGLNWRELQSYRISRILMSPMDRNTIIAGGSGIFKSTDGGLTWIQTSSESIHDMEFRPGDQQIVYAAGSTGAVFRSTDSGTSWIPCTNGLPEEGGRVALGVSPAQSDVVYALLTNASSGGFLGLYRSTNSGETWTLQSNSPNLLGSNRNGSDVGGQGWYDLSIAVSTTNVDEVFVGGINIWRSSDGGVTWQIKTLWYDSQSIATVHADHHDLFFVPGTNILYDANDGGVHRTTDGGEAWEWLGSGLRVTQFYRLAGSVTNPDLVLAGSQDNGVKKYQGGEWYDVVGGDGMETIIDYTNPAVLYGEFEFGQIFKSMDGGHFISPISNQILDQGGWVTPFSMHPTNPNTLFAGYVNVWRTRDGGESWDRISSQGTSPLEVLVVAPSDPSRIYSGTGSTLSTTSNGGVSWTGMTSPAGAGSITSLAVSTRNPENIWITSSGYSAGQKVWESSDAGQTWTNISGTLPNVPVNSVVFQSNSLGRLYIGTDIGVYYRDQGAMDWQDFNAGLPNVIVTELEIQHALRKIRAATYGRGIWESDLVPNSGILLCANPDPIRFIVSDVVRSDTLPFTMQNCGDDTLEIFGMHLNGAVFRMSGLPMFPFRLGPSELLTVDILFQPTTFGRFNDTIVVASNAQNGPITRVPLSGQIGLTSSVFPGTLYATSPLPSTGLFSLSTASGLASYIAPTVNELSCLTVRPATQRLYGIKKTSGGTWLYQIGPDGEAFEITSIPIANLRALAFSPGDTLYGGTDNGILYRINPTTGQAVFIGQTPDMGYSGFSFRPSNGELWACLRTQIFSLRSRIYKVNISNGTTTFVGETGDGWPTYSIAFGPTGILYGLKRFPPFESNTLISIDTNNAHGTIIGLCGVDSLLAIAMRTDSVLTSAPENSGAHSVRTYSLSPNYPNPFNPSTVLAFEIPERGDVSLVVYDILGRKITQLTKGQFDAGAHSISWDGTTSAGEFVSSGIYFVKFSVADDRGQHLYAKTSKLMLIR